MDIERIKQIQQETAYPESISVHQALLKVWNECEQERQLKNCDHFWTNTGMSVQGKNLKRCIKCGETKQTNTN